MNPEATQMIANLTGVLVQAAHPKRVILFGSQATGDSTTNSDFDIMVVEEHTPNRFAEKLA
jgi:predicted nucleotidyltransferase